MTSVLSLLIASAVFIFVFLASFTATDMKKRAAIAYSVFTGMAAAFLFLMLLEMHHPHQVPFGQSELLWAALTSVVGMLATPVVAAVRGHKGQSGQ